MRWLYREWTLQLANCLNQIEAHLTSSGNRDLIQLHMAARTAISEKVDNHQMTPAEAEYAFAQIGAQVESTAQDRQLARGQAFAATAATISACAEMSRPYTLSPTIIQTPAPRPGNIYCRGFAAGIQYTQ